MIRAACNSLQFALDKDICKRKALCFLRCHININFNIAELQCKIRSSRGQINMSVSLNNGLVSISSCSGTENTEPVTGNLQRIIDIDGLIACFDEGAVRDFACSILVVKRRKGDNTGIVAGSTDIHSFCISHHTECISTNAGTFQKRNSVMKPHGIAAGEIGNLKQVRAIQMNT